jgi:acyl-CoA dehydrogenase
MRLLVFPLGALRRPASDKEGKAIVREALAPGGFRDRLTRGIFLTDDPNDRVGVLEYTLKKAIAAEEADKKLERAIRQGEVQRFYNNDWIAEAQAKGVLTEEEARQLAELRELTARVIAVDDFEASEVSRQEPKAAGASPSFKDSIAAE